MGNLIGSRFGRLVVEHLSKRINKNSIYLCQCDCGKQIEVYRSNLVIGDVKSCGCLRQELNQQLNINLLGQTFGQLTVIAEATSRGSRKRWLCSCSCGAQCIVYGKYLRQGFSKSCGCLHTTTTRNLMISSPLMSKRYAPIKRRYSAYKAKAKSRNIEFSLDENTFKELVEGICAYCHEYSDRHGIDRVDSNKGYTEDNCVTCCWICNRLKGAMMAKEFILHCRRIANNHKNDVQRDQV